MKTTPAKERIAFVVILLLSNYLLALAFHGRGKAEAFREMKTIHNADTEVAAKLENRLLQEYVKARYYYVANRSKIRRSSGESDLGPVDEEALGDFVPGKDTTSLSREHEQFREQFVMKATDWEVDREWTPLRPRIAQPEDPTLGGGLVEIAQAVRRHSFAESSQVGISGFVLLADGKRRFPKLDREVEEELAAFLLSLADREGLHAAFIGDVIVLSEVDVRHLPEPVVVEPVAFVTSCRESKPSDEVFMDQKSDRYGRKGER